MTSRVSELAEDSGAIVVLAGSGKNWICEHAHMALASNQVMPPSMKRHPLGNELQDQCAPVISVEFRCCLNSPRDQVFRQSLVCGKIWMPLRCPLFETRQRRLGTHCAWTVLLVQKYVLVWSQTAVLRFLHFLLSRLKRILAQSSCWNPESHLPSWSNPKLEQHLQKIFYH